MFVFKLLLFWFLACPSTVTFSLEKVFERCHSPPLSSVSFNLLHMNSILNSANVWLPTHRLLFKSFHFHQNDKFKQQDEQGRLKTVTGTTGPMFCNVKCSAVFLSISACAIEDTWLQTFRGFCCVFMHLSGSPNNSAACAVKTEIVWLQHLKQRYCFFPKYRCSNYKPLCMVPLCSTK